MQQSPPLIVFEPSAAASVTCRFSQLDPVLAQGAGVALEDAFLLARYLKDYNDSLEHSLGASKMSTGVKGAGIETVLARYDEERLRRSVDRSRPAARISIFLSVLNS